MQQQVHQVRHVLWQQTGVTHLTRQSTHQVKRPLGQEQVEAIALGAPGKRGVGVGEVVHVVAAGVRGACLQRPRTNESLYAVQQSPTLCATK